MLEGLLAEKILLYLLQDEHLFLYPLTPCCVRFIFLSTKILKSAMFSLCYTLLFT